MGASMGGGGYLTCVTAVALDQNVTSILQRKTPPPASSPPGMLHIPKQAVSHNRCDLGVEV